MSLDRARELLPAVVITVLSMLQALALELYWNQLSQATELWQGGMPALLGWLQYAIMLLGVLLVWLFYVSLVLRFTWLPSMEDTITPFIIGLLEFSMISAAGPGTMGPWFMLLSATFAVSVGASHLAFRRARRDPQNAAFFDNLAPASWRDYLHSTVMVGLLLAWGIALSLHPSQQGLALAGMLLALLSVASQLRVTHKNWIRPAPGN